MVPKRRSPPEERKENIRFELTERTLELAIAWVYALREKVESLEKRLSEQSISPLETRIARLESEVKNLRAYLKACGIKPPDTLMQPEFAQSATEVAVERVEIPVAGRPAFSPPPPELGRTDIQIVTGARWGEAVGPDEKRKMFAMVDGYPENTPAVFRVFRRDLDFPLATIATVVHEGMVAAEWDHGDVRTMPTDDGRIEFYFEVEVDLRKTTSPVITAAGFLVPSSEE